MACLKILGEWIPVVFEGHATVYVYSIICTYCQTKVQHVSIVSLCFWLEKVQGGNIKDLVNINGKYESGLLEM